MGAELESSAFFLEKEAEVAMKEKTLSDIDREIMQLASKLQMSLGEALFRAKNLNTMLSRHPELEPQFGAGLEKLVSTLNQITHLYRHNFADEIESSLHRKAG